MSKKPSGSEPLSAKQDKQEKGSKGGESQQQQHHRQGEPMGQKRDQSSRKKQTVQFDEGQKFTSDDDLLKRRSA